MLLPCCCVRQSLDKKWPNGGRLSLVHSLKIAFIMMGEGTLAGRSAVAAERTSSVEQEEKRRPEVGWVLKP